ncbi:nitrogen fixation-related uncharacterized protein [Bacillus sp. OAE603]
MLKFVGLLFLAILIFAVGIITPINDLITVPLSLIIFTVSVSMLFRKRNSSY